MWVLHDISPTTFNVFSDLMGEITQAILLFVLGIVYPYLIWGSVKHGRGVALDDIITPPDSMLGALMRLPGGSSVGMILSLIGIIAVATFSHVASDFFLEFITVQVGTNDTYFLSPLPGGLPLYSLLGPQNYVAVVHYPAIRGEGLLHVADGIARGLSRFSILDQNVFLHGYGIQPEILMSGLVLSDKSTLRSEYMWVNQSARHIPSHLQVECRPPSATSIYTEINGTDGTPSDVSPDTNIFFTVIQSYVVDAGDGVWEGVVPESLPQLLEFQTVPDCDYENTVSQASFPDEHESEGWEVLDWSLFHIGPSYDGADYEPFGARDSNGNLRWWIEFSRNSTELPFLRKNWQLGRRVQDGLSLAIGISTNNTDSPSKWREPYLLHKEGVEFQVEYSVLSGPGEGSSLAQEEENFYTLSSWSRNCPIVGTGNLSVDSYTISSKRGCIIDTVLKCQLFPQDVYQRNMSLRTEVATSVCIPVLLSVTLLSGVEVDPFMLAAYAGIATRNKGINGAIGLEGGGSHVVAINSIAAAYIMTRKVIPGTVAVEGVRASIKVGYVAFMILPLLLALLLLFFLCTEKESPPVPRSIWDLLVLGQGEGKVVPKRAHPDSEYPSCPSTVKFGMVPTNTPGLGRLGLGSKFLQKEDGIRRSIALKHQAPQQHTQQQQVPKQHPKHQQQAGTSITSQAAATSAASRPKTSPAGASTPPATPQAAAAKAAAAAAAAAGPHATSQASGRGSPPTTSTAAAAPAGPRTTSQAPLPAGPSTKSQAIAAAGLLPTSPTAAAAAAAAVPAAPQTTSKAVAAASPQLQTRSQAESAAAAANQHVNHHHRQQLPEQHPKHHHHQHQQQKWLPEQALKPHHRRHHQQQQVQVPEQHPKHHHHHHHQQQQQIIPNLTPDRPAVDVYHSAANGGEPGNQNSVDWREKCNPLVKTYLVPGEYFGDKPAEKLVANLNSQVVHPVISNPHNQEETEETKRIGRNRSGARDKYHPEAGKNVFASILSRMRNSLRKPQEDQANNNQIEIDDSWNAWISPDLDCSFTSV